MRFHLNDGNTQESCTKWESSKIVLDKIKVFYEKANITMVSDRKACEKMKKLLEQNDKICAIPADGRSTSSTKNKVQEMDKKLEKTFQI